MTVDAGTPPTPPTPTPPTPPTPPTSTGARVVRRGAEILATGRRKTAVARVRMRVGGGEITVNGRDLDTYFPSIKDRVLVSGALEDMGKRTAVKVTIKVNGGGPTGQAGACRLGIARALKVFDVELAEPLRQAGLLTRDGRMKERKKYGLRGARRGTQFSKR